MKPIQSPLTIFLIGATGDLAKKKVLKAIFSLYSQKLLPAQFTLIGNGRSALTREEFHDVVKKAVRPKDDAQWENFCSHLQYVSGDVSDRKTFQDLKKVHASLASAKSCGNHIWYVATLPHLYPDVVQNIKAEGLGTTTCGWTKFLLEKPFGTDLNSARLLNKELLQVFSEDQIFRIDHYAAKETVQNLLVFRFANGLFEHIWNHKYIDHIQVTSSETLGVDGRELFYDETGTIRDVVQNHILQIVAMALMEPPRSLESQDIREKRRELIADIRPFDEKNLVEQVAFGQYKTGKIDGQEVRAFRDEKGVQPDSKTETAVAMKFFIDNERWHNVPIYVRAGKRLSTTVTEITIQFKATSHTMFGKQNANEHANILDLRIGPNEGVVVRLYVKKPGLSLQLQEVPMQFCYKNQFQMDLVEAYEKLIYDAVQGDPTLFPHASTIESAWKFVQPLLNHKNQKSFEPDLYEAGSWGPPSFETLIKKDGRSWIEPSIEVCAL